MKTLMLILVAFALTAGAAFADSTPGPNPAQLCSAQRTAIGGQAFTALYGGGANAFGKCVSKLTRAEQENATQAEQACRDEQSSNPTAFASKYGTGKNKANAFGKCVSSKASAHATEEQQATINAAKQCKAERSANPTTFGQTYGTAKNAFGKCVSAKAKAQNP
jgi:hypothetical protein